MPDWSQIVEEHSPIVWRTALRLLRNNADAADCAQHAFLAAVELSRTEAIRHWPALLKRLATIRALEQLRTRKRELGRIDSESAHENIDHLHDKHGEQPESVASTTELGTHLRSALTEIDSRQAQIFCLMCFDELSFNEVAEQLGIKTSHVRVLLSRAKQELRVLLKSHDPRADSKLNPSAQTLSMD